MEETKEIFKGLFKGTETFCLFSLFLWSSAKQDSQHEVQKQKPN